MSMVIEKTTAFPLYTCRIFPRFIVAKLSDSIFTSGLTTTEAFHYHCLYLCSVNINGCDNSIVIVISEYK